MLTQNRLKYIDTVKGIGILLVVLGHNLQGLPELTSWIYAFHMPLFFIVTGYLEAHKLSQGVPDKPISVYIRGKAASLLWPYFTFSVVNLLWLVVFSLVMNVSPEAPFPVILLKMLTTYGYRALWFLPALFFASLIQHIAGKKAPVATMLLSVFLGSVASLTLERLDVGSWLRYPIVYFGRIAIGVSFICVGKWLYFLLKHVRRDGVPFLALLCFAVTLLYPLNSNTSMAFARMGSIPLYYLMGCAGSIGLLLLAQLSPPSSDKNIISSLGRNSLVIMALHMDYPIEIAWMIIGKSGIGSRLSLPAASGIAILIEMAILAASIAVIHKFPSFITYPINSKRRSSQ